MQTLLGIDDSGRWESIMRRVRGDLVFADAAPVLVDTSDGDGPPPGSDVEAQVRFWKWKYSRLSEFHSQMKQTLRQERARTNKRDRSSSCTALVQHDGGDDNGFQAAAVALSTIHREATGRLTSQGIFVLGLRKALGGFISGSDLACVLLQKIPRQTVYASENRVNLAIVAHSRALHASATAFLQRHMSAGQERWLSVCYLLQGDATNSRVWMQSKLHVLKLQSA